jgi:hypothetical protein
MLSIMNFLFDIVNDKYNICKYIAIDIGINRDISSYFQGYKCSLNFNR